MRKFCFSFIQWILLSIDPAEFQEEIKKKDEHLLSLLKEVYVDSKDPLVNVSQCVILVLLLRNIMVIDVMQLCGIM